jgi:hypothetical protein
VGAAARAAGLPLHAVHGLPIAETPVGVRVLALAEALVRGPSLDRVRRVVDALGPTLPVPAQPLAHDAWWREVRSDVALTTPERWARAIGGRDRVRGSDRVHGRDTDGAAAWLLELVRALSDGPARAGTTGDTYLEGEARAAWRRALDDGPAHALTASAARLRTGDGVDPACAIAYGPATTLARSPRPFAWLLGVSARSWPRRPVSDPLLPEHVLGAPWPGPSVADLDRRAFRRFAHHSRGAVVLSRARRDGEGRELAPSPLLVEGAAVAVAEHALAPTRAPEYALDEADRLASRPADRAADPLVASATRAWHDWHADRLTPHDGLVRARHPALVRAMARTHSATSLQRLLRDPQGFVWRYALGFMEPDDTDEPFELDPRAFGTLVHDVLERSARSLDAERVGAFAGADDADVVAAVDAALAAAAREAETTVSVPPPVAWHRVQRDARDLALAALRHQLEPLPDARTFVEVPFGHPRQAPHGAAPWDPSATVAVGNAGLRIRGSIDRLDVAGDRSLARVVDYKTGRVRDATGLRGLRGGQELQRCLYALAVRYFLGASVWVEAVLLYPRDARAFDLDEPDVALAELVTALDAAHADLLAGRALPGPDAFGPYNDMALALPADATRRYGARKAPLVREALPTLATLWGEP